MKKLGLSLLFLSLIGVNNKTFSNCQNDPGPLFVGLSKIKVSFDETLTSFFNHEIELDSTLKESCIKFVEKEVDGKEIVKGENYAYYHQMWELSEKPENYKTEGLCKSLLNSMSRDDLKNYIHYIEGNRFWVESIEKNGKYYLVIALN
ncbi:MAG: hypothetical protein EBS19_07500 [Spirochaetia bacterium]|nr:hypothetical protein [Spirochaetia bacterium]